MAAAILAAPACYEVIATRRELQARVGLLAEDFPMLEGVEAMERLRVSIVAAVTEAMEKVS